MTKQFRFSNQSRFLLAILVLCLCVVSLLQCGGSRSEQYRRQGDIYLKQNSLDQAVEEYQYAIEADMANANAHYGLGKTLALQGNHGSALEELEKAISHNPDLTAAYVEAVRIHLSREQFDDAEQLASRLEEVDPENGVILHAMVLRENGQLNKAVELLEAELENRPDSSALRVNLAATHLANDDAAAAESILTDMEDSGAADGMPARLLLVDAYRAQGKLNDVVSEMQSVVEENPDDLNAKLVLALGYLDLGDVEKAEELAFPLLDTYPDSGWVNFAVGSTYLAKESFEKANEHLLKAAHALPQQTIVAQRLEAARARQLDEPIEVAKEASPESEAMPGDDAAADTASSNQPRGTDLGWRQLWETGGLSTLVANRSQYLGEDDPHVRAAVSLAALFAGNFQMAAEIAGPLSDDHPVARYLSATSGLYSDQSLETEEVRAIVDDVNQILASWQPSDPIDEVMKGNAEGTLYARLGLRARAFSVYSEVVRDFPENGVAFRNLASMYRAAQMNEFAAAVLDRLVSVHPDSREARQMLLQAFLDAGMRAEAQRFAEATYARFPDDSQAVVNLARLYLNEANVDVAIQVLEQAAQDMPGDQPLKVLLASAYVRDGQPDKALSTLDNVSVPESLIQAAREIRVFARASGDDWNGVLEVVEGVDDADLQAALRLVVAAAHTHLDEVEQALSILPGDDTVQLATSRPVAVIRKALGGDADLPDPEDSALASTLNGNLEWVAAFAYGVGAASANLYEQAYETFQALYEEHIQQPIIVAYALDSLGNADTVEDRAQKAESLSENHSDSPMVLVALAGVYDAVGDVESEGATLQRAAERVPNAGYVWQRYAVHAIDEGDDDLAAGIYAELQRLYPDNPYILNNFAYYLVETGGDLERAAEFARRASEAVEPTYLPNVLHTLGLAQLRQGQLEDSEKNLQNALQMRPGDPTLTMDYGQVLMRLGKNEEGRRFIESAIFYATQLGMDFPRIDEARALLEQAEPAPV